MRFSENWLRKFCNPNLSSKSLSDALTMAGLEVEDVESIVCDFSDVVVGQITQIKNHPNAPKLLVCNINIGKSPDLSVVCGDKTVKLNQKVAYAKVGGKIKEKIVETTTIRGITSDGMLCSEGDLGLSDYNVQVLTFAEKARNGEDISANEIVKDNIFTIKPTADRGDCLSLLGIAREVSAITSEPLVIPNISNCKVSTQTDIPITVHAAKQCPRYSTRVIRGIQCDVKTPQKIVRRLERSGVRSINIVVDLTNYVMLEMGQPLHAFDLNKINQGIDVRFAYPGEKLELLNGQTICLETDMLTICDSSGPVALAGIMGGQGSAVDDETFDLLLESAFFSPEVVAGMWRRLGFTTDALHRFERGVDFSATVAGLERLTQLITRHCGGQVSVVSDVKSDLPARNEVKVSVARCEKVLGIPIGIDRVKSALNRLHFENTSVGDCFTVRPPSYRFDILIEEDLIEEIARIDGYDKLPATLPYSEDKLLGRGENETRFSGIRQSMIALGYSEVITYSFVDSRWELEFAKNDNPIKLKNPISEDMNVMRSSLMASLVDRLSYNLNRKQNSVRIFELGRVFSKVSEDYVQPYLLTGLVCGGLSDKHWDASDRTIDFFDCKGDVETLFSPYRLDMQAAEHPALHPGKTAKILCQGIKVGWLGVLHPRIAQKRGIKEEVVIFEVETESLAKRPLAEYKPVSKYPMVFRDLSVLVPSDVAVGEIFNVLNGSFVPYVLDFTLFDVYSGKGIQNDKKGLAFRVLLQDTHNTLKDQQVDESMRQLVMILKQKFKAELRE